MLTLGKAHRLSRCATPDGKFVMLALDHRNNLRRALAPDDPARVSYEEMADFKEELARSLSPVATGILLDPEYGLAAALAGNALDPRCGLLVAVEETGYTGAPTARESKILPGWSVEKVARAGAAGVKLLIYYHPQAPNAAAQEALVREVAESCRRFEMPFFLEPLSFSLDPGAKRLSSSEKRYVVVETARRLTPLGVDVLKAEFPLHSDEEPDEHSWLDACQELSAASRVPWLLLSAGVSFEHFVEQTRVACQAGASGVLAGRAVWKEAVTMEREARPAFFLGTARKRMLQLAGVVGDYGKPWIDFHPDLRDQARPEWYAQF